MADGRKENVLLTVAGAVGRDTDHIGELLDAMEKVGYEREDAATLIWGALHTVTKPLQKTGP